jgi:hypothetical protein
MLAGGVLRTTSISRIPVVVAPGGAATTSSSVIQVFMPNMVTGDQIAVSPVETYRMKRGMNSSGT